MPDGNPGSEKTCRVSGRSLAPLLCETASAVVLFGLTYRDACYTLPASDTQ